MDLKSALLGLLIPGLAACLAWILAWGIGRLARSSAASWGVGLAIGAGYVAGHFWIAWPSSDVTDRIPFVVLAAAVLGLLEWSWPSPAWARWENRILLSALVVVVMVGPADLEVLGVRKPILWQICLGVGILLSWTNLESLARRITGVAIALPLVVVCSGAGASLLLSGGMVLARLAGALTVSLAAIWLLSIRSAPLSLARCAIPVVVVALASLLLEGHVYAELPTLGLILLAASPAMLWITQVPWLRRMAPWRRAVVGTLAVMLPLGLAAATTLSGSRAEGTESLSLKIEAPSVPRSHSTAELTNTRCRDPSAPDPEGTPGRKCWDPMILCSDARILRAPLIC